VGQKRIKTKMQAGDRKIRLRAAAIIDEITELGGTGGLIVIDNRGNISLPFKTAGMYRGHVDSTGQALIEIYK
jgi:L-asparaginase / beta-aspartyl-peptidase